MSKVCPFCGGETGVFQTRYVRYDQFVAWDGDPWAGELDYIPGRTGPLLWRCQDCKKVIKDPPTSR